MTAWAYCIAWNEAALIKYWVRSYRAFCDRVVVYVDTGTDDGTAELARAEGAETRPYANSTGLDDIAFVEFAQEHYREARGQADWVIWTDADEFLFHPRMTERLADFKAAGVNVPRTVGYSMMANSPPAGDGQIYDEIRSGFEAPAYSKVAVFDPNLDVTWQTGKHRARIPDGVSDDGSDPLKLLHYRWLGEAYFLARNQRNFARIDERNRAYMHGRETYPGFVGDYSPAWYAGRLAIATEVVR